MKQQGEGFAPPRLGNFASLSYGQLSPYEPPINSFPPAALLFCQRAQKSPLGSGGGARARLQGNQVVDDFCEADV